jgi:hypothetical protein
MGHPEFPFKPNNMQLQHGQRFAEISMDSLGQYELMIVALEVPRSSRGGGTSINDHVDVALAPRRAFSRARLGC